MSELIQRVANAIAAKYAPAIDQRAPCAKIMMLEAAKAAIEAIREPTEAMAEAVWAETGDPCWLENAIRAWQAGIDAALADDQP